MKLTIEISNDLEWKLNKLAKKRKITIGKMATELLLEWLDDRDNKEYEKGSLKCEF